MDKILCWNVRGINNRKKQKDVYNYIQKLSDGIVCLLEIKVKPTNLAELQIFTKMFFRVSVSLQTLVITLEVE